MNCTVEFLEPRALLSNSGVPDGTLPLPQCGMTEIVATATAGTDLLLARHASYAGGISGHVLEIPTLMSPPIGPVVGWKVFLDLNHNGRADPREPTVITDASGQYHFANLAPGVYRVAQKFPAGWRRTPHTPASKTIRVVAGAVQQPIDFAVFRKPTLR